MPREFPASEPEPVGPNPADFPADQPFSKPWRCPAEQRRDIPDSACSRKTYLRLRNAVKDSCPGKGAVKFEACSTIYSTLWTCDEIKDLLSKWRKCCDARRDMMIKCFRGGDRDHKIQLALCEHQTAYCVYLLRYWECPGHGPRPDHRPPMV